MLEHFPVWCATQAAVGRESLPDVFVGKGLPTYNHICACIRGAEFPIHTAILRRKTLSA